jgi:hypothetical protein
LPEEGGSLNPRNDGPLMVGGSCDTGAETRGGVEVCARVIAGAAVAGGADDRVAVLCADVEATATGAEAAGAELTAAGVASSLAPHIPQKRFSSEFSLPQRGQRTHPPEIYLYSLRYLEGSMQAVGDGVPEK